MEIDTRSNTLYYAHYAQIYYHELLPS